MTTAKLRGFIQSARKSDRSAQAVTPFRIQGNKQILSVPTHNFQLKLRKNFRIYNELSTGSFTVDFTQIKASVRMELGALPAPAANTGELIAVHAIHVYSSTPQSQPTVSLGASANFLTMAIDDVEETGTTGANLSTLFEDTASQSGVCHVAAVFPVNNRPTFSSATTNAAIAVITTSVNNTLTVDVELTYVRTPGSTLLAAAGLMPKSRVAGINHVPLPLARDCNCLLRKASLSSGLVDAPDPTTTGNVSFGTDQPISGALPEYPHDCPDCHFSFQSLESLAAHSIEHTG